jgi:hypothetical protein
VAEVDELVLEDLVNRFQAELAESAYDSRTAFELLSQDGIISEGRFHQVFMAFDPDLPSATVAALWAACGSTPFDFKRFSVIFFDTQATT